MTANSARGEAAIAGYSMRPTFNALVAAEDEIGSLFALVERAAAGQLKLAEMVALFWHVLVDQSAVTRDDFAEAVAASGLAASTPALKILISQILAGR